MASLVRMACTAVLFLVLIRAGESQTASSAWAEYEAKLAAAHDAAAAAKPSGPESRTVAALSALYANDRRGLAKLYEDTKAQEVADGDRRELKQSDSLLYLFNISLTGRDDFLLAQEIAAKE